VSASVLAVTEHRQGELRDASFEVVTAGRELADDLGGELHLAVIAGDVDSFSGQLSLAGVDAIHTVAYGEEFNHDVTTQAITAMADELDPAAVLMPNTVNGLDYAPAVAERLGRPLVTDIVGVEYEDRFVTTREMYGSKVETTVEVDSERVALTIRDGEWPEAEEPGEPSIGEFAVEIDEDAIGSTVTGFEEVAGGDVDISEAEFLVSVGRGIEEEENIALIEELVEATGATLSASRPIVDNEWLPKNRQVGQSGKSVTPKVYLAIGISGAVQHVAGMKGAETIVAVNTDPNAPIFDLADYGIVGDLFEVVPVLIEEFGG